MPKNLFSQKTPISLFNISRKTRQHWKDNYDIKIFLKLNGLNNSPYKCFKYLILNLFSLSLKTCVWNKKLIFNINEGLWPFYQSYISILYGLFRLWFIQPIGPIWCWPNTLQTCRVAILLKNLLMITSETFLFIFVYQKIEKIQVLVLCFISVQLYLLKTVVVPIGDKVFRVITHNISNRLKSNISPGHSNCLRFFHKTFLIVENWLKIPNSSAVVVLASKPLKVISFIL